MFSITPYDWTNGGPVGVFLRIVLSRYYPNVNLER